MIENVLAGGAFVLVTCGVAIVGTRLQRSIIGPIAILAWTWTIAMLVCLVLAPDLPVYPRGYAVATLCVCAAAIGCLVGERVIRVPRGGDQDLTSLRWWCVGLALLGCLDPLLSRATAQASMGELSVLEMAVQTSRARYEGAFDPGSGARMWRVATFFSATLAGFLWVIRGWGARPGLRPYLWLLPLIGSMLIDTAKATVLYGALFCVAGAVAGSAWTRKAAALNPRVLTRTVVAVVMAGVVMLAIQAMRMDRLNPDEIGYVAQHLRGHVVGHMPVMGHWVTHTYDESDVATLGIETFAGSAELLGLGQRQAGLYVGAAPFTQSNIYTCVRPLLADFGFVGALLFMFLIGASGGLGWTLLKARRAAGLGPLAAFVTFALWSPITSIFVYVLVLGTLLALTAWGTYFDWRRQVGGSVSRKSTAAR